MKKFLRRNSMLIFFLLGSFIFMVLANRWFWPTPDEYLYAATSRSIVAGLQGNTCLSCLNTEHTYLVSTAAAFYQWLTHSNPFDLAANRIPVMLFSLGTIYLLWLMAQKIVRAPQERAWFLWLLLLIPGYFVLSTRFLLDMPLIFGFALLLYLLIIGARPLLIGLALAVILLTKDYGLYLAFPLVIANFFFDLLQEGGMTWRRWLVFIKKSVIALVPSLVAIVLLLGFNLLPYPRLLEANLTQYLGDTYPLITKKVLKVVKESSQSLAGFSLISQQTADHTTALSDRVNKIPATGGFPTAILDSPLKPEVTGGLLRKFWLIYQYNFSEQDVMIFVLPLFLTGLIMRMKALFESRKGWVRHRIDLLFLLLTLIFLFVNWHEALNIHGFRLTAPISLSLIYFSYWGARLVLLKGARLSKLIFATSFVVFAVLYANFILNLSGYGSVISGQSFFSTLLRFKLPIFMAIFLIAFVFMLIYSRLKWAKKQPMLAVWILCLFFLKFVPFSLEARAAEALYGYDYGLPQATPILQEHQHANDRMLTNVNPYTLDFYSGQLRLPNVGSYPLVRVFKETNPALFEYQLETKPIDPHLLLNLNISYVFYVNKTKDQLPQTAMAHSLTEQSRYFSVVKESTHSNRVQWQLYSFNKKNFLEDLESQLQ